jgi:hypothetical protein
VSAFRPPYAAEERARAAGEPFPRPRELYRYLSLGEYRQRLLYALSYPSAAGSVVEFLLQRRPGASGMYAAVNLLNHNLPMVLLFREALRIEHGDKKKAVGLLDEAIRIPYAWVKSIPRAALPPSLAFDNFLLPGNKEDGADKSRHWNVFGGVCLYKSPREAVDLALRREMQDLREARYSKEAMREFLRDMIGDLNGMYEVMSVNPDLLRRAE